MYIVSVSTSSRGRAIASPSIEKGHIIILNDPYMKV